MSDVVFAIPGDIDLPTGGYAYDRRVLALLPSFGLKVARIELPGSFPAPTPADLERTRTLLGGSPAGATLLIDGLAYGALPADLVAGLGRRIIALVHHPLYLETGLDEARRVALHQSEAAALTLAERVIVTSPATARLVASELGVPDAKIVVALPGTDPAPKASGTGTPMQLLAVGAVSPRKGYDVLVDALSGIADLDWRLSIVGSLERDKATAQALRTRITAAGLDDRVRLPGAVVPATLATAYDNADVFVMPSLFEGYGMVLGEAMAHGLPIVCTTGGAAAETVPDDAGLKVAPGDAIALRSALRAIITDRKLRKRLEAASWAAGRKLPTWHETTRRVFAVLKDMKV